jgi:hypothetical protein
MRKRKRRARNNGSMYEGKWTGILRKTVQGYDFQGSSYTRCEIAGIWLDAYSGVQGIETMYHHSLYNTLKSMKYPASFTTT